MMRADRLIAILLTLKREKKTTAAALAAQLEVSERTIYRDVVAMSSAGIPVYTEKGPGGGIGIVESFRADLVDLTADEVSALSLLSIPQQFESLGLASPLRSALQKLNVFPSRDALPQGILFDPESWHAAQGPQSHIQSLLDAYRQQRKVWVRYRYIREMVNEAHVDILGLAAKEYAWYVVWHRNGKISVHDLESVIDLRIMDSPAQIPQDFVLQEFWKNWCLGQESNRRMFTVQVKVTGNAILLFNQIFGSRSRLDSELFYQTAADAWVETSLEFESLASARYQLLGFGAAVEVLAPESLRRSMADFAEQICAVYQVRPG